MAKNKKKAEACSTAGDFSVVKVRVGTCPGVVSKYVLKEGSTLEDALRAAKLDPDTYQVRVNLDPTDLDYVLQDDDEVLACPPVQGS